MSIRARKPTGAVPWPLVLLEGAEKSGKSWAAAQLSASDRVGQTYWLDIGEGAADEYGAIPGARYLVLEHDGTWSSITDQVDAVRGEARRAADAGEPPVVLVVDSMTAEWDLLKGMADAAARQRLAKKGRKVPPGSEPTISMDLWNDVNTRHRRLMTTLMTFPGIVVVTARGKDVAALDDNGRPVEGSREYKVEAHKNLAFDCSVWVRMSRVANPQIVGCRSVHAGIRPGKQGPVEVDADQFNLEWLVFEKLQCDPSGAHVRQLTVPPDPELIREQALASDVTTDGLKSLWKTAKDGELLDAPVADAEGQQTSLRELIKQRAARAEESSVKEAA